MSRGWHDGFLPIDPPFASPNFWLVHVNEARVEVAWNNTQSQWGDFVPTAGCHPWLEEGDASLQSTSLGSVGPQRSAPLVWQPSQPATVKYPFGGWDRCELTAGAKLGSATTGLAVQVDVSFELGPRTQVPWHWSYRPMP